MGEISCTSDSVQGGLLKVNKVSRAAEVGGLSISSPFLDGWLSVEPGAVPVPPAFSLRSRVALGESQTHQASLFFLRLNIFQALLFCGKWGS